MKNLFTQHTCGQTPAERYRTKLEALPPTGEGYHPALLGAANLGVSEGLSDEDLFDDLRAHTDERGRQVPDSEIWQAIEKARQDRGTFKQQKKEPVQKINLPFTPAVFCRRLIEAGRQYSEAAFVNASSMHLSGHPADDSLCLLDAFYSENEFLFIGHRFYKEVHRVADWKEILLSKHAATIMPNVPHIIPNPMSGQEAETKDGKLSMRCDAAVKGYRFAMAEFDTPSRKEQLAFWATVPLPVAALIDSGGKSIHAWIKLSGIFTPEDWQQTVRNTLYRQLLVPMGVETPLVSTLRA